MCILTAQRALDPSSRSVGYTPSELLGKCTCGGLHGQQALQGPPTKESSEAGHRMGAHDDVERQAGI